MTYQSAQGLASLGRNGDSMLVHMSPTEVAGLQSLAMARGGSLTVNPDTGMPEAFNLGGVFKAALPMIAGAALGPAGFGLTGLQAGLLVGGATALLSGDIGQGIMAGFGAGAGNAPLELILPVFEKSGFSTGINFEQTIKEADRVMDYLIPSAPITTPINILTGLTKLFSGFEKPIIKASKLYGVEYSSLIFELGNRKLVAGQEDLILEVAQKLKNK